ncbi:MULTISPECIES: ABZJ_00895 family protein [Psychrobacter]|uniref:ABZJ_00895 family protein n=1 Tax=Psychrobacter TaxID=497 RepID=UPI00146AFA39|nr:MULTISPECIES: ABZJ_00895 family protein [Psychrobacter]
MSPTVMPSNLNKTLSRPTSISIAPFVVYFAIGFVLASAIFMLIQSKVALNSFVVIVISVLVAAFIATFKFTKQQKRSMITSEMNRLALSGTLLVWVLTAIYFLAIWLWLLDDISREVLMDMTQAQPMPLVIALVMMLMVTAISARLGLWAFNRLIATKP